MYIEHLVELMNNPALKKEDNPGRLVLEGTICEYLENYDNHLYDLFLTFAKGKYLDLHGKELNVFRRENESDTSYRNRILIELSLKQSSDNFLRVNTDFWVYLDNVLENRDVLTSRNPYLKDNHDSEYIYIAYASDIDRDYLKSKFLIGDILWV